MTPPTPEVIGLIRTRWQGWGGADGPFGQPLDVELPFDGTSGRRQPFEHGEILWAADQGMVLSVFPMRDEVCMNWSAPDADYAYFRVNCFYEGQPQGLDHNRSISGTDRDLQLWIRLQGLGRYDFQVAAFNDDDHTIHGWTAFAGVTLAAAPEPAPPPFPVTGLFRAPWATPSGPSDSCWCPARPPRRRTSPTASS